METCKVENVEKSGCVKLQQSIRRGFQFQFRLQRQRNSLFVETYPVFEADESALGVV